MRRPFFARLPFACLPIVRGGRPFLQDRHGLRERSVLEALFFDALERESPLDLRESLDRGELNDYALEAGYGLAKAFPAAPFGLLGGSLSKTHPTLLSEGAFS